MGDVFAVDGRADTADTLSNRRIRDMMLPVALFDDLIHFHLRYMKGVVR